MGRILPIFDATGRAPRIGNSVIAAHKNYKYFLTNIHIQN
jgi:hypothetical protein